MNGKESAPSRVATKPSSVLATPASRRLFALRMMRDRALAPPQRAPAETKKSA